MGAPEVLIRTPWSGPWWSFTAPDAVFEARRLSDVRPCLAEVDAAVRTTGGIAAGFVSYEAAGAFGLPVSSPPGNALPLVWFGVYPASRVASVPAVVAAGRHAVGAWSASISHAEYLDGIRRIRAQIADGNTYQINYTWRLSSPFVGDPRSLLIDLDDAQRGRWSAYLDIGRHVICSASPELFFALEGSRIVCRPMKGTTRRGLAAADDQRRSRELHESPKNRAENVMVVDMTRNDLGRIARVGSVAVPALFEVEPYPAQWQMVSSVTAEIDGPTLPALFDALFPSGSITGAPKHRSMQIIREVERGPRGIYTGAIGVYARDRAHFNVAIRTVDIDRETDTAEFGVGSGIVWDSVDDDEFDECLVKASILTRQEPSFELLETMAWSPEDGFALLDGHLDRLMASAGYFGVAGVNVEHLRASLARAVAGCATRQKVRLLVGRDGTSRIEVSTLVPVRQPLRSVLAPAPIAMDDVFLYHKTTRRAVYEEARRQCPEADTVILWNARGEITEATEANVVVEIEGKAVTPPVESGLLPGVMRKYLLASGEIGERRVSVADLRAASRIWLINSVWGRVRANLEP
jgi:para-aminobenzoate synthetase/4-amino-4-deoxychorismate lyase